MFHLIIILSTMRQKFLAEIKLESRLNHPNIVKFYGTVLFGGNEIGIVNEFVEQGSLRDCMDRAANNRLPSTLALDLAIDIAKGLEYIHSFDLIHRDVKPENVLIRDDGSAILTDFGVSTLLAMKNMVRKRFDYFYHFGNNVGIHFDIYFFRE